MEESPTHTCHHCKRCLSLGGGWKEDNCTCEKSPCWNPKSTINRMGMVVTRLNIKQLLSGCEKFEWNNSLLKQEQCNNLPSDSPLREYPAEDTISNYDPNKPIKDGYSTMGWLKILEKPPQEIFWGNGVLFKD